MRKILCVLLCVLMLASALVACGGDKQDPLKIGLGVYTTVSATDAGEANGKGTATMTVAAVLVDANGKIVQCQIDCADNKVEYSADGKAVAKTEFKTKYEMGAGYNMVAYGGATKEWFEQADAFEALCVGKTATEVLALVVNGDKGTDEVLAAGCTITVNEMALAVEKAVKNAKESTATAADTLKLATFTELTSKDATEDAAGQQKLETSFVAVALDGEDKVKGADVDCVQVAFGFDAAGKSTFDASKAVLSKRELGDGYNMVAYGGAKLEWYAQADAFEGAIVGKTVSEIKALMGSDLKGNEEIIGAGCTIMISGFVYAMEKLG